MRRHKAFLVLAPDDVAGPWRGERYTRLSVRIFHLLFQRPVKGTPCNIATNNFAAQLNPRATCVPDVKHRLHKRAC